MIVFTFCGKSPCEIYTLGVPQSLQKVVIKGLAKDEKTLREAGIIAGAKVMVVGSKLDDVIAVSNTSTQVNIKLRISKKFLFSLLVRSLLIFGINLYKNHIKQKF